MNLKSSLVIIISCSFSEYETALEDRRAQGVQRMTQYPFEKVSERCFAIMVLSNCYLKNDKEHHIGLELCGETEH